MAAGRGPSGVSVTTIRESVGISERSLLALGPWAVVGASAYALFQVGAFGTYGDPVAIPVAYLGTALLAGLAWVLAALVAGRGAASTEALLAGAGAVAVAVAVGVVLSTAEGGLRLAWPVGGVLASAAGTAALWVGLGRARPALVERHGGLGILAAFGHVLDGVMTAIGIDVLGFGERTPTSRLVIEFAADLPTAQYLGGGWLFVLLKIALVVAVLWLLVETVEEDPTSGLLLLAVVAAVGLGPGLHNTLLFVVA